MKTVVFYAFKQEGHDDPVSLTLVNLNQMPMAPFDQDHIITNSLATFHEDSD